MNIDSINGGLLGFSIGAIFCMALTYEDVKTNKHVNNLIEDCQAELPRDEFCTVTVIRESDK